MSTYEELFLSKILMAFSIVVDELLLLMVDLELLLSVFVKLRGFGEAGDE